MRRPALLSALAALALAGCASTPPQAGAEAAARTPRQCFWASNVNGFNSVDRDTIRVTAGVNDVFELDVSGAGCFDVDWATAIGLRSRGGDRICSGYDAEIVYRSPNGLGPQRCFVTDVRRVSEAQLEAEKAARQAR